MENVGYGLKMIYDFSYSRIVSEFLTEVDRHLILQQSDIKNHPCVPEEARCYLKPGMNQEADQFGSSSQQIDCVCF
ncbi:hypothetical protein RCL_jg9842.t1 [Rhizophagus clarus]|uniref:Uncharacterized protein n=1 Tax=Rhizophagus clarus TaxID=94130 RepID=A0A8H3LYT1_9GLOM|nr:hypothetical protein RCL_jg9842.t1 [Rhizophagus clarus]